MTTDIKYDFLPFDGTPGQPYDDFEERLLNSAAGRVDERGWSLADPLSGIDEGSAGGPVIAGSAAEQRKAQAALRKRSKESYGIIVKHLTDASHLSHIHNNHFQIGLDSIRYLQTSCRQPVDRLRIR